jgi:hypothetical protein
MIPHALLIIGSGLLINVADAIPKYDVARTCRAAVAMTTGAGQGRTVENCVAGEEAARKDLEKHWATAPAAERTQCSGTVAVGGAHAHSYVELLICLEMMRDSRVRRDDEQTKAKQLSPAKRR